MAHICNPSPSMLTVRWEAETGEPTRSTVAKNSKNGPSSNHKVGTEKGLPVSSSPISMYVLLAYVHLHSYTKKKKKQ